ncbi:hypothetical protein [Mesorhizobium amorphae]
MAENGDGKQHEMPTDADNPMLWRPGSHEWPAVESQQSVDDLLERADMAFSAAFVADRATIEWFGNMFVDQQALDDAGNSSRIRRQGVEQGGMTAGRAEG